MKGLSYSFQDNCYVFRRISVKGLPYSFQANYNNFRGKSVIILETPLILISRRLHKILWKFCEISFVLMSRRLKWIPRKFRERPWKRYHIVWRVHYTNIGCDQITHDSRAWGICRASTPPLPRHSFIHALIRHSREVRIEWHSACFVRLHTTIGLLLCFTLF